MAFNDPHKALSLYPQVNQSNPDSYSPFFTSSNPMSNPTAPPHPPPYPPTSTSSPLYPSLDMHDLAENLFPNNTHLHAPPNYYPAEPAGPTRSASAPPEPISYEETLITVPGAIVHLIDQQYSVELACGDFSILRLWQGESIVAVLARVADEVQWPLMKDEAAVRVDESHYFFSLRSPSDDRSDSSDEEQQHGKSKSKKKETDNIPANNNTPDMLNYGLSFALKGQENLLLELDQILSAYSAFSVQSVSAKSKEGVLDGSVAKEISPEEMKKSGKKREAMERRCGAYWTTLAPNVEDYSGTAAKVIASGSGYMIKGILWCGDVTVDRLKWGNDVLVKRLEPNGKKTEISPETKKRLKRVKGMTKMTEKVAVGVLAGVVKVSGYLTSSVANSSAGKKFFSLLPGEILLASLDGFNKICDAVEVSGRHVMSTSNTVTTGVVTHKYGEEAGKATHDGLGAAGHAFGTAWAAFKVRKALNPKSVLKPTTIAKTAAKAVAEDHKKSKSKKSSSSK